MIFILCHDGVGLLGTQWGKTLFYVLILRYFDTFRKMPRIAHSFDKILANFSSANISRNIASFGLKFFLEA